MDDSAPRSCLNFQCDLAPDSGIAARPVGDATNVPVIGVEIWLLK
jgi:hypothetical protein